MAYFSNIKVEVEKYLLNSMGKKKMLGVENLS
jgi:hypothetical protein